MSLKQGQLAETWWPLNLRTNLLAILNFKTRSIINYNFKSPDDWKISLAVKLWVLTKWCQFTNLYGSNGLRGGLPWGSFLVARYDSAHQNETKLPPHNFVFHLDIFILRTVWLATLKCCCVVLNISRVI